MEIPSNQESRLWLFACLDNLHGNGDIVEKAEPHEVTWPRVMPGGQTIAIIL